MKKSNNRVARRAITRASLLAILSVVSARAGAQTYNCSWITTSGTTSWFTPGSWQSCNSTSPDNAGATTYGATIAAAGTYTIDLTSPVTLTALDLDASGATLSNSSTLTVTNGVTLQAGTIAGGTIVGTGGTAAVALSGTSAAGTLSGVTLDGSLDITGSSASALISNGITLHGTGGTGSGTIDVTGEGAALEIAPTTTSLDNLTINMGVATSGTTYLYAGYGGTGTLTLGSNATLLSSGGTGTDYLIQSSQASIVNDGAISVTGVGHGLTIEPNSFTNNGTVTGANGTTLALGGNASGTSALDFTNAASGTVTMNGTGGSTVLEIGYQSNPGANASYEWTNAGTINLTDTDLKIGGYIKDSDIGTLNVTGGSEQLLGYLDNSAATLNVSSGPLAELSMQGGTIHGGVIQGGSGNLFAVQSAQGTLDAVQVNGPLNLTGASASVLISNGITADTVSGSAPGTINVTGEGAALEIAPTTPSLNNLTINMGVATSGTTYLYAGYGGAETLTLGANATILSSGGTGTDYLTQSSVASIVNDGAISVTGVGHGLTIEPNSFTNNGTVTGANGTTVVLGPNASSTSALTFTNAASGTVTMNGTGGSTVLEIGYQGNPGDTPSDEWTNAGTISVTDTDVKIGGYIKDSDIGTLNVTGGSEQLLGYLDNSGTTLNVLSGPLTELSMQGGTIHGGVIQGGSGNLFAVQSAQGTLDAVQVNGPLNLSGTSASALISNGITADTVSGSAPGTINVTGEGASLEIAPTTPSLNNLTINMGVATSGTTYLYAGYGGAGTLTLGANATLVSSGGTGTDYLTQSSLASIVNDGSMSVQGTGHELYVEPNSFTNNGTLTAQSSGTLEITPTTFTNFSAGTLTGGTYQAESAGTITLANNEQVTTLSADVVLNGAGSTFQAFDNSTAKDVPLESSLTSITSSGALHVLGGRSYATTNAISNQGTLELGGGTFSAASLSNGGTLEGFGTVTPSITNTGAINATGGTLIASNGIQGTTGTITVASSAGLTTEASSTVGTLTNSGTVTSAAGTLNATAGIQGPSGTLVIESGGAVTLGAASTVGTLTNDGTSAGSLALGGNSITVSSDYDNASFGSGSAFNPHANVSGSGKILAAGTPGMSLTGTAITAGGGVADSTATLNVGNIRVGGTTTTPFDINNVNPSGGPSIRGADESAGLTTPGLSVSGASFGAIAVGSSAAQSLSYTPTQSGALTGQSFTVASNFDNVGSKTVSVTGAAYQAAVGQLNNTVSNPNNFNFGVIQVGQSVTSNALSITNAATGAAGYVEDLNAAFGAVGANTGTGMASITGNGSISGLTAGGTNASAMTVTVEGTTAGTYTGGIAVNFETAGTVNGVSDGLGTAAVGSADYGISGTIEGKVVNEASPLINNPTIALGNVHVGGSFGTATVSLTNQATTAPQAALDATISGTAPVTGSGTVTLLAPGSTDDTDLTVGIGNTSTAGHIAGTATVGLVSDASNQDCTAGCTITLPSQDVSVSGNVYQYAQPSVPSTVSLGNFRVGSGGSQAITIGNTSAAPAGYQEGLDVATGATTGGVTASGAISNLAAGSASSGITVGIGSVAAGVNSGSATLALTSNGTIDGLASTSLGTQTVTVSANGYQAAQGALNNTVSNPSSFSFGTIQVGQSVTSNALSVSNVASGPSGYVEDLNASFGSVAANTGTGTATVTGNGSINGLAAGGTDNSSMTVTVQGTTAGTYIGGIAVNFDTAGTVNGTSDGLGAAPVGSATYGLTGAIQTSVNVVNDADPVINNPTISLGNVRQGATSPTAYVSLSNQATTAPQAALDASISSSAPVSSSGSVSLLGPGSTNSGALQVGIDTATAGAVSGTATVGLVSDASNVGGCSPNCQMTLPSQSVSVSGDVYRVASPTLNTPSVTLAARVGDASPTAAVSVTNTSPDQYTEGLAASMTSAPTGWSNSGAVTNLAAGGTDGSTLKVALNTGTPGVFTGTQAVSFTSNGLIDNATPESVGSGSVQLEGSVYTPAVQQVDTTSVNFGVVHVGDVIGPQTVSVTNAAPSTALNDVLTGNLTGGSGPFSASGNLGAGLAAGQTDATNLKVSFNTSAAGMYTGSAQFGGASHDSQLSDLSLGSTTVSVSGQVNNYANATFALDSGSGSLSKSGSSYVLNLGNLTQGASIASLLSLVNQVAGPADDLEGSFATGTLADASLSGSNWIGSFSGLGAGQSLGGLGIDFSTGSLGSFDDTILLNGMGYYTGASYGAYADNITLTLEGDVVKGGPVAAPEIDPGSAGAALTLLAGLLAIARGRRRTGVQKC